MANKEKQVMDYWKHSTILFNDTEMQILRARVGLIGYTMYCYLMEKINRDINNHFILTDDYKYLTINDLQINEEKFNFTLEAMLEIGIFDKNRYTKSKILTNKYSEANKKIVKTFRADAKNRMQETRNCSYKEHSDKNNVQEQSTSTNNKKFLSNVLNKDNISKDKLSEENIIIVINEKTITTKIELYNIISSLLNTKELNQAQSNIIDKMYNENSTALSKAIENCQISANGTINMNYLSKAYETAKTQNLENLELNSAIQETKEDTQSNIDEAEELEKLKEARRKRKANKDNELISSEDIEEDLEYEELKKAVKEKQEKEKIKFYE